MATAADDVSRDNARLAIATGLGLPAVLSLFVLVGTRWALPPELQAEADDPVLHTFFGLAGLPFTAGAIYTLVAFPIRDWRKRCLGWLWLVLALVSAGYTFGGWRLMNAAPVATRSSAATPPDSSTSVRP